MNSDYATIEDDINPYFNAYTRPAADAHVGLFELSPSPPRISIQCVPKPASLARCT
jgi:hypothetical protein